MKSTLITLIVALVRQLIGSDLWGLIAKSVSNVDGRPWSGSEKREAVYEAVELYGAAVTSWLINLAIEAAVAKLKVAK